MTPPPAELAAPQLVCQRLGCTNTFPPTVRPGGRGGRMRRFCSNVCAVQRGLPKRGSVYMAWGVPGDPQWPVMWIATDTSTELDSFGRPKTIWRYGRTPEEAEQRLSEPPKR